VIRAFRDRLVAEHAGVEDRGSWPPRIDELGSMAPAVAKLSHGPRRLERLADEE
jgi:hypothetical protein